VRVFSGFTILYQERSFQPWRRVAWLESPDIFAERTVAIRWSKWALIVSNGIMEKACSVSY
jgi:hypothetical protein